MSEPKEEPNARAMTRGRTMLPEPCKKRRFKKLKSRRNQGVEDLEEKGEQQEQKKRKTAVKAKASPKPSQPTEQPASGTQTEVKAELAVEVAQSLQRQDTANLQETPATEGGNVACKEQDDTPPKAKKENEVDEGAEAAKDEAIRNKKAAHARYMRFSRSLQSGLASWCLVRCYPR